MAYLHGFWFKILRKMIVAVIITHTISAHLPVVLLIITAFLSSLIRDFGTRTPGVVPLAPGAEDRPPADIIGFKVPIHDAFPATAPRAPVPLPPDGVLVEIDSLAIIRALDGAEHPVRLAMLFGSSRGFSQVHRELILPVPLSPTVRHYSRKGDDALIR